MKAQSNKDIKISPMMRQYYDLKNSCQDEILFFRMGDFFEIFAEDAEEVAPKLEIVLTSREKGDNTKVAFCGVPHHSADSYWLKLLKMGYKVAIADQVEKADQAKGLVKREIVKRFSPGCIDTLEALEPDRPNYLLAVYEEPENKELFLLLCDISTGELRLGRLHSYDEIREWLEKTGAKEILRRKFSDQVIKNAVASYLHREKVVFSDLPEAILRDKNSQDEILGCALGLNAVENFRHTYGAGAKLVASLFSYLEFLKVPLDLFLTVKELKEPSRMALDDTAIRDLEIFTTSRSRQTEGSLFRVINHTLTASGARLLRWSLTQPFYRHQDIVQRQKGVGVFKNAGAGFHSNVRTKLKSIGDIERIFSRIITGRVNPIELARLRDSLASCLELWTLLATENEPLLKRLAHKLEETQKVHKALAQSLLAQPGVLGRGNEVFQTSYCPDLAQHLSFSQNGQAKVDAYLEQLKQETGIQSLKIKGHKTFGLVIEVTKTNLGKIPESFVRKQTMVGGERFVTVKLRELDEALSAGLDKAIEQESCLFARLLVELRQYQTDVIKVCDQIAEIDLLQGLAWLSLKSNYATPTLSADGTLALAAARHAVVEQFVGLDHFTANDIYLRQDAKQMLITGPNMAGKSTTMRLCAINAILHQIGSDIPAKSAKMPLFDQVFTRVGSSDDLSSGLSTFMVEMTEAASILRKATKQSLIILDEVGRGTSTQDGLAIAFAIISELHQKIGAYTLFATHYHELVPLCQKLGPIAIMQTEVKEANGKIDFTHKLIPGASANSFGIEVAQLAGIPQAVIHTAKDFLAQGQVLTNQEAPPTKAAADSSFLAAESELISKIKGLRIDRMRPIDALNMLSQWQENLASPKIAALFGQGQKPLERGLFSIPPV